LLIFGAVPFTEALISVGKVLGYRVSVCDARPGAASSADYPNADEVVEATPESFLTPLLDRLGPNDATCFLTHDHQYDVPGIAAALKSDVGYIGVLGSRHTHADRLEKLRAAGVDDSGIARLMAPIGIDIGARTPEEAAVAICAEIIARRAGVHVPSLRDGSGPIHRS
jgi:xanthine dehydrogenase accessory factor